MEPGEWRPLAAQGLGRALVSVSAGGGFTASLHRESKEGPIWLLTKNEGAEGSDASAAPTYEGPASCIDGDFLVLGSVKFSPSNVVTVGVADRVQSPKVGAEGAWLTVFERVSVPADVIVREFDSAGVLVSTWALDFPADPPMTLRMMLCRVRTWSRRHRSGRMPTRTTTYP